MNKEKKEKKLFFTEEERGNVQGRIKYKAFMEHLVDTELSDYINSVVFKRLKIKSGTPCKISENADYLIFEEAHEEKREKTEK